MDLITYRAGADKSYDLCKGEEEKGLRNVSSRLQCRADGTVQSRPQQSSQKVHGNSRLPRRQFCQFCQSIRPQFQILADILCGPSFLMETEKAVQERSQDDEV